MADHKDAPCLMGLPPEIRELIWSYALIEPEPILAYVVRQTVLSSKTHTSEFYKKRGISTVRQRKTVPGPPPLALVGRSISREIFPIFFRNTFMFSVDYQNVGEVAAWVTWMYDYLAVVTRLQDSWLCLDRNITIRIEFTSHLFRVATIEYKISRVDGVERFRVELGGYLKESCSCWLCDVLDETQEEFVPEEDREEAISCLTQAFEKRLCDVWLKYYSLHVTAKCADCGKTQYQSKADESRKWYMWPREAA
ncbi:hypothetical protein LTR17_010834 [Elasticomyces elasticus]|nr:hypothetical protein LTR17_010834 [Elasticomyces elasticus]